MATYIPAFKGFIADVPEVWFTRCDKRTFHFDKLTSVSGTPQIETTDINGGWSLFPLAQLPGQSTYDIEMTSAEFNADIFSMANAVDFEKDTFTEYVTEYVELDSTGKGTLTGEYAPDQSVVYLDGKLGEDKTEINVTVAGEGAARVATITYADGAGQTIQVMYTKEHANAMVAKMDNQKTAVGTLLEKWPVYNSGDDCTKSAIVGYYYVRVYRCRVTQTPGIDSSYKQASELSLTFSAMDAHRADRAVYEHIYLPKVA